MITINIDKSGANKQAITDYLINVVREIQKGNTIGEDWELHGDEQESEDVNEPDDFTGPVVGEDR